MNEDTTEKIDQIDFPIYDERFSEINDKLMEKKLFLVDKKKVNDTIEFYLIMEIIGNSVFYQLIIITQRKFVDIIHLLVEELSGLADFLHKQIKTEDIEEDP